MLKANREWSTFAGQKGTRCIPRCLCGRFLHRSRDPDLRGSAEEEEQIKRGAWFAEGAARKGNTSTLRANFVSRRRGSSSSRPMSTMRLWESQSAKRSEVLPFKASTGVIKTEHNSITILFMPWRARDPMSKVIRHGAWLGVMVKVVFRAALAFMQHFEIRSSPSDCVRLHWSQMSSSLQHVRTLLHGRLVAQLCACGVSYTR